MGGWYLHDDFPLKYMGVTQPFRGYVFQPYGGHLSPLSLAVDRLRLNVAPDYWSAAAIMVVSMALAGVAIVWLLDHLELPSHAVAFGALVLVVTPVASESSLWWASGLTAGLLTPLVAWGLVASILWVESGRLRWLVSALALQAVALGCYTKAVALPAWILLTLWAIDRTGHVRRILTVATATLTVVMAYLLVVLMGPSGVEPGSPLRVLTWARLVRDQALNVVLPGLGGGPWTWWSLYDDPLKAVAPSPLATAVGLTIAAALVVILVRGGRPRMVVLIPGWIVVGAVVHVVGRGDADWLRAAGQTVRYATEAVIPVSLTLAIGVSLLGAGPSRAWTESDRRLVAAVLAALFVASGTRPLAGGNIAYGVAPRQSMIYTGL